MPKLKKPFVQHQTQDSLTFRKYLAVQQMQTSIPQPINQGGKKQSQFQDLPQSKDPSGKKSKRSLKKQKNNYSQNVFQTSKTTKRKSRKKKVEQSPQKTEDQDQKDKQRILSPKPQKKQRSLRKNKKSSKKSRTEQNQSEAFNKNEDEFNGNQLRQKLLQNNETQDNKQLQKDERLNKSEQQRSPINFNKRLRKKNQTGQQDLNVLLSRYAEDESSNPIQNGVTSDDDQSGEIGYKFQSDLRDLDLLVKKKEKKQKKEKQIKIKNKYFSDISMSESYDPQSILERQDPPQNSEELIIEKKQPRKTIHNLNQVIEKRVSHIKDRREFKNSEGEIRFKNHLKNKLQQLKDVEQVQVDIEIPYLFTKKTASVALYMKNALQAEEKKTNFSKKNTQNEKKLQRTTSSSSLTDNKNQQALSAQHKKNQEFMFQMKKKGVKREDFFDHLNKQIKNKKHTEIGSQQIKDCFKSSSLNEQNFDVQLAEEALSNCSSRSNSRQRLSRFEMNGNVGENSNSRSFVTNRSSKHLPSLVNPPISEVKQSDASNSIREINNSCSFGIKPFTEKNLMRFDGKQIKEEVQKSFQRTLKIFQSQNQLQIEKNIDDQKLIKKDSEVKITNEMLQDQKESDKKLEKKLKQIVKNTNQKKSLNKQDKGVVCLDEMLGDNLNEENSQRNEKKKKKKQKRNKNKKSKQGLQSFDYESYFEVEAEYSSDESGHSDSQYQSLESDLDEEGDIIGLIDKDTEVLQLNQRKVKRKFLQDEEKRDQQMIEKIMKGLYGRKKLQQTDSEKRLRKRMEQAAKKNLLDDLEEINLKDDHIQSSELCQNPHQKMQKIPQKQNQNEENSKQMRKLKEMEELLSNPGQRNGQYENFNSKGTFLKEAWKIINPSLPVRKTILPSNMSGKRVSVDRNKEHRKSIFDTKKGSVKEQIFKKTIKADRPRAESTENRKNLQKTSQIRLQIRNTNIKFDEDIQI